MTKGTTRGASLGGWRSQTRAFEADAKGLGELLKAFRSASDKISPGRTIWKIVNRREVKQRAQN